MHSLRHMLRDALVALFAFVLGCSHEPVEACFCDSSDATVTIGGRDASASLDLDAFSLSAAPPPSVAVSGDGCVASLHYGETSWSVTRATPGACHIVVTIDGTTALERDILFEQSSGCCAGVYPSDKDRSIFVPAR